MLRRDGNVIGSPIETTQSSATGVFRIASGQQKQILAKFPEHVGLPEKPLFVSCLRGRTPAFPTTNSSTPFTTGLTPNSALQTGQILIRIASPQDWVARQNSALASNLYLEEERDYAGKATLIGYSVEITMADTGTDADGVGGDWQYELQNQYGGDSGATRSAFGTIFLPIEDNVDCHFYTHLNANNSNNNRNVPNFGTPFEDEDNVYNIILNDVTAGPVNRTGNTGLRGMPKDAYYTIRVFAENAKGASVSATESNEIDCTYDFATTSRYILFRDYGSTFGGYSYPVRPPGSYYLDFMMIGGGGSGGSVRGYGASGGGGAGAMVIAYGVRLKKNERTYNITVGTGGIDGNGTNSSAFGCIAYGGGKGASAGRYQTATISYIGVSAAQSGGCGGGAAGGNGASAGLVSVTATGLAGAADGKTSGASYAIGDTEFDQGLLNVYENPGGGVRISAGDTLRSFYSEHFINVKQERYNTNALGHGGGGVGNLANVHDSTDNRGAGGPGKFIRWATPGICSILPQLTRIPFGRYNQYNAIGRSPENDQADSNNPSNKGFYGGGGNAYNSSFYNPAVGGSGLGKFENQNFTSTMDGFTYNQNGVDGTGAGGGHRRSNNNDPNSFFPASDGGDGIVIIRMAASAHDPDAWGDTFRDYYAMSATGSYQATVVGTYIYYIFDGDGTFGPKGRAGITGDGN